MKYLFLILIVINPLLSPAQRKRESEMDLTFNFSPALGNPGFLFGFGFDLEAPVRRRLFSGVSAGISDGVSNTSYGYNTTDPRLFYIDLGWINEYRFLNAKRVKANVFLTNATALLELGDGTHQTQTYTNKGQPFITFSKTMAANFYYSVQPGADIFFVFNKRSWVPNIFLKVNYNFMYGITRFPAGRNDFEMITFSVGTREF